MRSEKTALKDNVEILVVEDSATQAEQLKHILEEHDYAVTLAANGKAALAAARQRKPALVLSDIVMPEMDGYQLCKAIKSDEMLKDIPVVLVTSLSGPQDVIKGLECSADSFIRKPYDEKYLLSRIEYLRANRALRQRDRAQMGLEIYLGGQRHFITSERQQILDLLISTYEEAIRLNDGLNRSYQSLNGLYRIAEGLNQAGSEREVCETVLERAAELPGVQAGWISLREGESGFRLGATYGLPPALETPGAMEGDCLCRRKLLAGELDQVMNILECERLQRTRGDTRGLRYHASVPLWVGDRVSGIMNLAGTDQGLFGDDDLRVLYGVGNQVGIALERAHLREHLEKMVEERTAALRVEIAERERAEAEIRQLNKELEQRVRQRTAQLEAANRELEAFSYSVSHDLRAPLRGIDGFSAALLEEYRERLDETGQHYLQRIQAATRNMGELIEALLNLSRVTRSGLRRERVDLSALAQSIAAELQAREPQRQVELVMAEGAVVTGDARLLRVMLENLLGNAWKFTGKRPLARIEFGVAQGDGERVYFVRDSGAGFDMTYADKLFGPFQRLHGAHEFPGTGIGLATVQRIVQRHGGRLWAEAGVEQGATFYFTLGGGEADA